MWFSFHSGYDRDYYGGGRGEFDSEPSARMYRNALDATKQHSLVFLLIQDIMVVEDTEEDAIEMAVCTGRDQFLLKRVVSTCKQLG